MILAVAPAISGDVVECANGDRYTGKVLLVNETNVQVLNDIHGKLNIPRERVATISFQTAKGTAAATVPAAPSLKSEEGTLKIDPAAIQQVQREVLGTANPEANQIFQEMVQGLASGKLNVGDVRVRAQETLNEVRQLQQELGDDDTAGLLSSYVSILETFVKNTGTNAPAPKQQPQEKQD